LTTREPTLTLQPTSLSDDCNAVRIAEAELLSSRLERDDITSARIPGLCNSWRILVTRLSAGHCADAATGGRVHFGADVVAYLGPFVLGTIGNDGQILSPARAPNSVLFAARQQGQAKIDVIAYDPWHAARATSILIIVE
jgi:hypothetical protein